VRIAENLYVVGSGDAGFGISGPLDATAYALSTPTGVWLFDVGLDSGPRVLENLRADGLDPADITSIFLTHYHADHAGALGYFRRELGPVQVCVAAEVAGLVRAGDEQANALTWARDLGYYPADFRLEPCEVDVELTDGLQQRAADVTLTAIETPGHCAGHYCFHVTDGTFGYLFSGDQVFVGGRILLQNIADASIQATAASMDKLVGLEFDALLPGHGGLSMTGGRRHVEAAAATFHRIGLPANLI
jgi:glyoxylase-like metal-dependent hydrolase (beta-lactamase superfamily II)